MTKSVKHKRARKYEIQKFNLKTGRKLLKAQNESKTDFKSRKIIIKEQLAEKSSSLITKKQLDFKELLSRLCHHSAYVRQDGIDGIKELLTNNISRSVAPHLAQLVQGLVPCITDSDHLIRSGAIKLLEIIILKMGPIIQPYFPLLISHLSYAMVHLNSGVQSDSLQLIDVFLSHTPSLIAQSSNLMLKNYLSLISRKMDKSGSKIGSFTLLSNPTSQLTTQKWRIKLLNNFCKYISAILRERSKLEESISTDMWQLITRGSMPALMRATDGRASIQEIKILIEEQEAQTFVTSLVPLLFQIWSEVQSRTKDIMQGSPLSVESIQTLTSILQIILHLWEITEIVTNRNPLKCDWFFNLFKNKLEPRILNGFPYCNLELSEVNMKSKKKNETKEVSSPDECKKLNILLANLSFLYLANKKGKILKILDYYCDIFNDYDDERLIKLNDVASTATLLLHDEKNLPNSAKEKLLKASLRCFKLDPRRYSLLQIPLTASDHKCQNLWKANNSAGLRQWIDYLIQECVNTEEPEPILNILVQFRLRDTPGFTEAMMARKDHFQAKMNGKMSSSLQKLGIEIIL